MLIFSSSYFLSLLLPLLLLLFLLLPPFFFLHSTHVGLIKRFRGTISGLSIKRTSRGEFLAHFYHADIRHLTSFPMRSADLFDLSCSRCTLEHAVMEWSPLRMHLLFFSLFFFLYSLLSEAQGCSYLFIERCRYVRTTSVSNENLLSATVEIKWKQFRRREWFLSTRISGIIFST